MECRMQSFHSEGSESYRSSSPLSMNEESVEFSGQKSTEIEENYVNDFQAQEGSQNLTNADLDTMMQNYKQLGGELELNLKILENKRLSLNKILIETKHECSILNQQKECQKKNLVDLQIRLENLDSEKMNIWKKNQKDKIEKTETAKQEMLAIFENDSYITNTYTKFIEIFNSEKMKCEEFFNSAKNEAELHKKEGENYITEVRKINISFKKNYEELLKEESHMMESLNATLISFKTTIESKKDLEEKIKNIKKGVEALERESDLLKTTIAQKKSCLNTIQRELKNFEDAQNEILDRTEIGFLDWEMRSQEIIKKLAEEKKAMSDMKKNLQDSIDEKTSVLAGLLDYDNKNKSDNQELNNLVEECFYLNSELNDAAIEVDNLESETKILPELTDRFNQLKMNEKELLSCIVTLTEEEQQWLTEKELKTKAYESIEIDQAISELEIYKTALVKAEAEKSDLSALLKEQRVYNENMIEEKEAELEKFKQSINENKSILNELEIQMKDFESNIQAAKNEMESVNAMLAKIEEMDIHLQKKEEEVNKNTSKIEDIDEEIVSLNEELRNVEMEVEGQNLDHLESELNKLFQQNTEAECHYQNQIETIKTSFQNQEKTCRDKAQREIIEIERKTRKEETHEKRVSVIVPRLNTEMAQLENDLKNLLPNLSKEIKTGLDMIDELATFYEQMFDFKKDKGDATTIRNLTSIEEQLASPMKCMMTLEYIPKISLNPPTKNCYKKILKVFKEKFDEVTSQFESHQPLEMANKLQEMGSCLFGKKYVKPTINPQVLNDTEISSSTEVYY